MGFSNSQHMTRTKGKTLARVAHGVCVFPNTDVQGFRFWMESVKRKIASAYRGFSDSCVVFV